MYQLGEKKVIYPPSNLLQNEEKKKDQISNALFGRKPAEATVAGDLKGLVVLKPGALSNFHNSQAETNSPKIIHPIPGNVDQVKNEVKEDIPDLENDICSICICNQNEAVLEECGHTSVCIECVSKIIKKSRDRDGNLVCKLKCPFCQ